MDDNLKTLSLWAVSPAVMTASLSKLLRMWMYRMPKLIWRPEVRICTSTAHAAMIQPQPPSG